MDHKSNRRDFLKKSAVAALAGASLRMGSFDVMAASDDNVFTLPPLPYPYEALEPHIDAMTMQIHHDRHHKGYVDNLNKAVKEGGWSGKSLEALVKGASTYNTAVRNNGGGHYNHSLFWNVLTPAGGGEPTGMVADAINASFGNFAAFREKFNAAAGTRFGSGWAWLVSHQGKLEIGSTPNQDNPMMDLSELKGTPILGLDVWEHAYYLKYQNKRADYVNAWWNLVNWGTVSERLKQAK